MRSAEYYARVRFDLPVEAGEHLVRSSDVLEQQRREQKTLQSALEVVHSDQMTALHSREVQQRERLLEELVEKWGHNNIFLIKHWGVEIGDERALAASVTPEIRAVGSSEVPECEKLTDDLDDGGVPFIVQSE